MCEINIKGIKFFAYHGVHKSEKEQGQFFVVDCGIELINDAISDDLSKTVNYSSIAKDVIRIGTGTKFDLIETLADEIAKNLMISYAMIQKVTIVLHKPHAPMQIGFDDISVKVARERAVCYLSIGSNLGNKREYLDLVWNNIEVTSEIIGLVKSDYIQTSPYGVKDQPDFLNGIIKIKTILTPHELLKFCWKCEHQAGRVRTRHWGERTLDVDILMYGNKCMFTDDLKIPHPEMHVREFVLRPLVQIEPYLIHPVLHKNVSELLIKLERT